MLVYRKTLSRLVICGGGINSLTSPIHVIQIYAAWPTESLQHCAGNNQVIKHYHKERNQAFRSMTLQHDWNIEEISICGDTVHMKRQFTSILLNIWHSECCLPNVNQVTTRVTATRCLVFLIRSDCLIFYLVAAFGLNIEVDNLCHITFPICVRYAWFWYLPQFFSA